MPPLTSPPNIDRNSPSESNFSTRWFPIDDIDVAIWIELLHPTVPGSDVDIPFAVDRNPFQGAKSAGSFITPQPKALMNSPQDIEDIDPVVA